MSKKVLRLLIIGASFAAVLLVKLGIDTYIFTSQEGITEKQVSPSFPVTYMPRPGDLFLGPYGVSSKNFTTDSAQELIAGPGQIIGSATVNGMPARRLKLRLYLNKSLLSPWATTDSNGHYQIGVPYGRYKIEGFLLDMDSANSILPGKIVHPQIAYSSETFQVSEAMPGPGLNIRFTDPIKLEIPKEIFSPNEKIVINWNSYPAASEYVVQLYETSDLKAGSGNRVESSSWPFSKEPFMNLTEYFLLKRGHYYTVYVAALNDEGRLIAYNDLRIWGFFDFKIVD